MLLKIISLQTDIHGPLQSTNPDILPDDPIPMEGIDYPYLDEAMEDVQPTGIQLPQKISDSEANYSQYIYNTNNQISSRQMMKSWTGGFDEENWMFGMEEFHAHQVDRDRHLAQDNDTHLPKFVRFTLSRWIFLSQLHFI